AIVRVRRLNEQMAPAAEQGRQGILSGLPVVPAASFGSPEEETEHPQDEPDDEQQPQDVQAGGQQAAPAKQQKQQDQDDQRNHSSCTSFPQPAAEAGMKSASIY